MEKAKQLVMDFVKDEEGATAIEYGIMIALISAALIGTISLIGGKLLTAFQDVEAAL
jgi:pilus assembly protein Flp/PilA